MTRAGEVTGDMEPSLARECALPGCKNTVQREPGRPGPLPACCCPDHGLRWRRLKNAEYSRRYYHADKAKAAAKMRAYRKAMFDRIGDLVADALENFDYLEVERAVDAVLVGAPISGLHRDDRLAAAVECLRRGHRGCALTRLRLGGQLRDPLLRWWDAAGSVEVVDALI